MLFDTSTSATDEKAGIAAELDGRLAGASPRKVIETALEHEVRGRLASVSSFGTESAVLLHMIAQVDPATPVLFLDTHMLFPETLAYRDELVARLGLRDVRTIYPDPTDEKRLDPETMLWAQDPAACCGFRKVEPLARALEGFHSWFNGRKRYHGDTRTSIPLVEAEAGRLKFNPLAAMEAGELKDYFERHDLPRHPLQALGFASIGCMPCTSRVKPGENVRAGRWRGTGKTECGIHFGSSS